MIPKQVLTNYKKTYEKAMQLHEDSENYHQIQKLRARSAAIKLLQTLKNNITNALNSRNRNNDLMYQVLLMFICHDLGRFHINCDEIEKGRTLLKKCMEIAKRRKIDAEAAIPYIGAMIDLGFSYNTRRENIESKRIFIEAEEAYKKIKESNQNTVTINDVFNGITNCTKDGTGLADLENLFAKCSLHMSEVYLNLNELKKFAQYASAAMGRMFDSKSYVNNITSTGELAINAAKMSSEYYIKENMFKTARSYMAAATFFITEYKSKIESKATPEASVKHVYASVARHWTKYGVALLAASKDRLCMGQANNLADDMKQIQLDDEIPFPFPDLQLDDYEKDISADYCLTYEDAKKVCLFVIKRLDIARKYYETSPLSLAYADILRDAAKLHEHFAYFEENSVNKLEIHKQRVSYYEDIFELLNPMIFMPYCRECWYELGSAYCDMLDIERDIEEVYEHPFMKFLGCAKLHRNILLAIRQFENFISSYKCTKFSDLNIGEKKRLMLVHFKMGKLYAEVIMPDHPQNHINCLHHYKTFISKCTNVKELDIAFTDEINHSREEVRRLSGM